MSQFRNLLGFSDSTIGYQKTKEKLLIGNDNRIQSKVNGKSFGIGQLEVLSLRELRERLPTEPSGKSTFRHIENGGDVRKHLIAKENAGAVFQVASQFNLLEMAAPALTPEDGVDIYYRDRTQGPACSTAAIGATLFRNYFVEFDGQVGQTANRQINCLQPVLEWISAQQRFQWKFQNGYVFLNPENMKTVDAVLDQLNDIQWDELKQKLKVGVHWNVQVNDHEKALDQFVTQIFCSAFPLAYNGYDHIGRKLAKLILEAAQEATVITAAVNKNLVTASSLPLILKLLKITVLKMLTRISQKCRQVN